MAIRHYCISLDCPSEWQQALTGIRHTFGHTWENCYAMYLTTGLQTYLYCFEDGPVRIVCPICEREYQGTVDITKPFGFSGFVGNAEYPAFNQHWKAFAKDRGYVCGYLGLNPLFDYSSHFEQDEVVDYETVHVLDLSLELETLLANMKRMRRRELRDWELLQKNLVYDRSALSAFFLEHYESFVRSKNAESFYFFSPESLSFLMNLDNTFLVGVQISGNIVAVLVNTYTPYAASGLFIVSLPEGRAYTTALTWAGLIAMKNLGIPLLNMGGGAGGVSEYKRYYGGMEFPLRCLKQVYQPELYGQLCQAAGIGPDSTSSYFPAYRQPAIMEENHA